MGLTVKVIGPTPKVATCKVYLRHDDLTDPDSRTWPASRSCRSDNPNPPAHEPAGSGSAAHGGNRSDPIRPSYHRKTGIAGGEEPRGSPYPDQSAS